MLSRFTFLLCMPIVAWGATYSAGDVPYPVPAWSTALSTISISSGATIDDIAVTLDISGGDSANLYIELYSPSGSRVVLHNGTAPFGDGIRTTFSDYYGSKVVSPSGLAKLEGERSSGTWLLIVDDASNSGATLESWSLSINKGLPTTGICATIEDPSSDGKALHIYDPFTSLQIPVTTVTVPDQQGKFCAELAPGVYWVVAETYHDFCGEEPAFFTESALITVVQDQISPYTFDFEGLLFKGCGGGDLIPPTVVGTVRDADTDQPIPNALVSASGVGEQPTDEGVFFFVLPDYNQTLSATAPGYNPSGAQVIGGSGDPRIRDIVLEPLKGNLVVYTLPTAAADAGARWRFEGGPELVTETTITDIPVGDYEVSFTDIPGWTTPQTATVTIEPNLTVQYDGIYVRKTGSVQVFIEPQDAIDLGAQWRLDGGQVRDSGDIVEEVPIGAHTVTFTTVGGWNTPSSRNITVDENATSSVTGTYGQGAGSLQVTLQPEAARVAGAQWRVDGGAWQDSNVTLTNLMAGSHELEFRTVNGWDAPEMLSVMVAANQTTQHTGTYTRTAPVADIDLDNVVNAVDVQLAINAVLGLPTGEFWFDVNNDGVVNAVDIQTVINAALSRKGEPIPTPGWDLFWEFVGAFKKSYQQPTHTH